MTTMVTTEESKVVVNKKATQSNANKCTFEVQNEANKANKALMILNQTRVQS